MLYTIRQQLRSCAKRSAKYDSIGYEDIASKIVGKL